MFYERETTLVYSASIVFEIRKDNPDLSKFKERWGKAFGGEVETTLVDGRLVVRRKNDKIVGNNP